MALLGFKAASSVTARANFSHPHQNTDCCRHASCAGKTGTQLRGWGEQTQCQAEGHRRCVASLRVWPTVSRPSLQPRHSPKSPSYFDRVRLLRHRAFVSLVSCPTPHTVTHGTICATNIKCRITPPQRSLLGPAQHSQPCGNAALDPEITRVITNFDQEIQLRA